VQPRSVVLCGTMLAIREVNQIFEIVHEGQLDFIKIIEIFFKKNVQIFFRINMNFKILNIIYYYKNNRNLFRLRKT